MRVSLFIYFYEIHKCWSFQIDIRNDKSLVINNVYTNIYNLLLN